MPQDEKRRARPQPPTRIGGTVTGLTGFRPVPQTNAGDVASGFQGGCVQLSQWNLAAEPSYTVTVKTQPSTPAQNCVVTNGSGTVGTANITTVAVACWTVAGYTVGGTVSGLAGSGGGHLHTVRQPGRDGVGIAVGEAAASRCQRHVHPGRCIFLGLPGRGCV